METPPESPAPVDAAPSAASTKKMWTVGGGALLVVVVALLLFFVLGSPQQPTPVKTSATPTPTPSPAATTTAAKTFGGSIYTNVQTSANPITKAPDANPLHNTANPFAAPTKPAPYKNPFSQ